MQLKTALVRNSLAGGWSKISTLAIRLVQVPLLLQYLGVDEYGRWLVLVSLPSWLALANLGFGSVAGNEMSMAVAAGDVAKARRVFATSLALLTLIIVPGTLLILGLTRFVPWENFLGAESARHSELANAVTFLSIATLLSFSLEVFGGRFRAARKAHASIFLSSIRPWGELLCTLLILRFSTRFDYLAFAILGSTGVSAIAFQWLSWRAMPQLGFAVSDVQPKLFTTLFQKGIAFQSLPLGNALLFQGNLLVIQHALGPAAVALFGTARTLVRSISQLMELVNQVIWPELSLLIGAGDHRKAARLHRAGVAVSTVAACVSTCGLAVFGQMLYGIWTGKAMPLPGHLLLLFLLPIPVNALWYTSSVVHAACNHHEGLAIRYLIGSSLALAACAVLSRLYGVEGAALSTLAVDIILLPYVLRKSIALTHDSWGEFTGGLLEFFRLLPSTARLKLRL